MQSSVYKWQMSWSTETTADGRVRLRRLTNNVFAGSCAQVLGAPKLLSDRLSSPTIPLERRQSLRLKARLEAELTAGLSLLEPDYIEDSSRQLVLMGVTLDLSATGLAFILPSIRISEDYCGRSQSLLLALHLPTSPVQLEIEFVHCVPLNEDDLDQGYLIGARIKGCGKIHESEWQKYLSGLR